MRTFYNTILLITFLLLLQPQLSTVNCQLSTKSVFRLHALRQIADSVELVMDIDLREMAVGTERSLTLTPILSNKKGKELALKSVLVNGRHRHKAFMREMELNGWERQVREAHYVVIPLNGENRKVIRYRQSIPYENWMRDAELNLQSDLCGCGGHTQQLETDKLARRIVLEGAREYNPSVHVAYIRPEAEAVKARSEQSDVFLDFPVARTEINPSFGNNPRELAKIESIINEIRTDKNLTVTGVMITGYASPEGNVNTNNQLARGRAEALRNYLSMRVGIPSHLYRVGYGGEDWEGLARLVQESYIEPKGIILSIINYYGSEERKNRLKALNGGQTYRRLLNELYPRLRRVVSRIEYTARNFNVEEAKQVIKTQPRQLSLNEMFLVANTYGEGSREFSEVFETAVKIFPDDPVANLNAAASALKAGEQIRAERYLEKAAQSAGGKRNEVRGTGEYYNNLGVLEMLKGNTARAKSLFRRAAENNLDAALRNLEEIKKKEEAERLRSNH